MRDQERIDTVLQCFSDMGATEDELANERERLMTDDTYYKEWCDDIGSWVKG